MKETGNIPIIPVIHVPALLRQNIEPTMSSHAVCKKSYFFGRRRGLRVAGTLAPPHLRTSEYK